MRLIKGKNILLLTAITLLAMNTHNAFASEVNPQSAIIESVKVGKSFINADGYTEEVIRINSDGSYITTVFDQNINKNNRLSCVHPAASLVAVSNLANDTKTVATSSCCYRYRSVTKCRCKKCGATIKTYGAWKIHKSHNFPLFSKTCKTCGYKK